VTNMSSVAQTDDGRAMGQADCVRAQLALLAEDVGRLRAHLPAPIDSYPAFLAERIAVQVEWLDTLMWPTAADIYQHFVADGFDEDTAVSAALDAVDEHVGGLRSTLRLTR